jgi:hypothetical protein
MKSRPSSGKPENQAENVAPGETRGALRIVYRPLADLVPYARNARTHSADQIAQLRSSLARYGWTNAKLIADGEMIAGHGRLQAALDMLREDQAIPNNPDPRMGPTVDLSHLSEVDRRAYRIADNQYALLSGWDDAVLKLELGDLQLAGFDLMLTGFAPMQLTDIFAGVGPDAGSSAPSLAAGAGSLAAAFGVAPFTVLNAREGWWQDRKRAWLALGIQSELGRGENLQGLSEANDEYRYNKAEYIARGRMNGTPPHPPTVTQNPDGTLNYSGTRGQAKRFDAQRQQADAVREARRMSPGGDMMPAMDYRKTRARGNAAGRSVGRPSVRTPPDAA